MPYDFIGCMEPNPDNDDKWRPRWNSPCDAAELPGCMEPTGPGGLWLPKLVTDVGSCSIDESGCMQQAGGDGKWQPVVTLADYDNANDFRNSCCPNCDYCFGVYQAPPFITVTFANIIACDESIPGANDPVTLEWNKNVGSWLPPEDCWWTLFETKGEGKIYTYLHLFLIGAQLRIDLWHKLFYWINNDYYIRIVYRLEADFTCTGEGPFTNDIVNGDCGGAIWGYDGTATIDWDP